MDAAYMENFDDFILARTIHVIAVVAWIGGLYFVTVVLIPALKEMPDGQRLELFEQLEGRFSFQAKIATLLTGVSGYYMMEVMDAWHRFQYMQFWWMHLMMFIWLVFMVVLFVLEPWFLHRWFKEQAIKNSEIAFAWLHLMHKILLTLSLIASSGAVAGAHGFQF